MLSFLWFAWGPRRSLICEAPSFGQARRSAFGAKAAPPRAAVAYAPDLDPLICPLSLRAKAARAGTRSSTLT
jgi:hypothetical protein